MKKKKAPQKASMPDFEFKEFTPEEDRIYGEAVTKFREAVAAGKSLRQVYESYAIADKDLEKLIQADFLKILIAERHYSGKEPLDKIGDALQMVRQLGQHALVPLFLILEDYRSLS